MELRTIRMTNEEGKRDVRVCNQMRTQAYDKIMELLDAAGLDPVHAANGDIAFALATDETSGEVYCIRLAVSLSNKPLDAKTNRRPKPKAEQVEVPNLFED